MTNFKKLAPEKIKGNPFQMIGRDWMLVTATDKNGNANTMTASWGGVGVLWNEPVAFVFVRPQRHTHNFTEEGDTLTLSFFGGAHRDALAYCGRISGRDEDKFVGSGLTRLDLDGGAVTFEEAQTVLVCRKLYADKIKKDAFCDTSYVEDVYPAEDFHTVYVVKIEEAYEK